MISLSVLQKAATRLVLVFLVSVAAVAPSMGQQYNPAYVPEEGQEGKDVIWLPTESTIVDTMLTMGKVGPGDVLVDLGSGDGRTVIAAAKRGATAKGIEFNPDMVGFARQQAEKAGVAGTVEFIKGDIYETDFSFATVVTMFLLDEINLKLRPRILEMKPGTRIVTNTFTMGDWKADAKTEVAGFCEEFCTANLWYVPAKIEGRWKSSDGELDVRQAFQYFSGTMVSGGQSNDLSGGKIKGSEVRFQIGRTIYSGVVDGDKITGTKMTSEGNPGVWQATRLK